MHGVLLGRGLRTRGYSMREFIDLAWAVWADDTRAGAREKLGELLLASLPDRDAWGTDPAAVRAQRAMMAQAGAPARRRPKPEEPPAP